MSISWKPLPGSPVTDPPTGGTWELKNFSPITLAGDFELVATLVKDGKGGYQVFGQELVFGPVIGEEGEVVNTVLTGYALFQIDRTTEKVQMKTLDAYKIPFNRDGEELLRQCINEELATMTLDEMLERVGSW